MSGARWSTAEGRPRFWAKWLSRWRRDKQAQPAGKPEEQEYPLVLVGMFDTQEDFIVAADAFAAAGFSENELACVRHSRCTSILSCFSHPRALGYLRSLLASGGACVLVLSVVRFPQACQIIEQAGGWIGTIR